MVISKTYTLNYVLKKVVKNYPTGTPRRFDVDSTPRYLEDQISSIPRRPNFDEFPRHFQVLFNIYIYSSGIPYILKWESRWGLAIIARDYYKETVTYVLKKLYKFLKKIMVGAYSTVFIRYLRVWVSKKDLMKMNMWTLL